MVHACSDRMIVKGMQSIIVWTPSSDRTLMQPYIVAIVIYTCENNASQYHLYNGMDIEIK